MSTILISNPKVVPGNKTYAVHGVMPDLFVCFAQECRIDNGIRILKRAVRHAIDPRMPNFMNDQIEIGIRDNNLYFNINGQVRASMKSALYNTRVAFSKQALLACTCSCQSGCEKENRHACIHVLAKAYQLTIALYDGLAENLLVELLVRIRSTDLTKEEHVILRESTKVLMCAAGVRCHDEWDSKSLFELLGMFAMSTDRAKKALHPPRPQDLRFLREIVYMSPETRMKHKMKHEEPDNVAASVCEVIEAPSDMQTNPTDKNLIAYYYKSRVLCDAIDLVCENEYPSLLVDHDRPATPVGKLLLSFRTMKAVGLDSAGHARRTRILESQVKEALSTVIRSSPNKKKNLVLSTSVKESRKHSAAQMSNAESTSNNKKRRRIKKTCCAIGCKCSNVSCDLIRVPVFPPGMDPSGNFTESRELSQQTKVTRQVQLFKRREILARLGKSRNCGTKDLQFCVCPPVESEIFKI